MLVVARDARQDGRQRRRTSSPADGTYGVLPVDMLRDILLFLPANVLCRLRLVCRSWRSLTSDPFFAKAHSRRRPHVVAVHRQRRDELHVVDLQDKIVVKRIHLTQAGDYIRAQLDLVCVVYRYSQAWGQGRACVLNLHQGNGSAIADITEDGDILRRSRSCIRSRVMTEPGYVLGHVPSTGEYYKMLRLYESMAASKASNQQMCHVMTLGSGSSSTTDETRWRATPDPPVLLARRMAIVSGVTFFLVSPYCSDMELDSVASFDLATEEWRSTVLRGPVQCSTKDDELRFMFTLVELGDCLVMVHHSFNDLFTDLWFVEDMNKSLWTKRCSVRWTVVDLGRIDYVCPLMVSDDGRIVFFVREAGIIGTYDPRTSSWVDLAKMGDYFTVAMHQGSLLCSGLKGW